MDKHVIVSGDFNARHPSWEPDSHPCPKGKLIAEELLTSRLVMMNDGTPTTIPRINSDPTAIDLPMASGDLAGMMEWKVEEEEFGSSHLCIVMSITTKAPVIKEKRKKVNMRKAIDYLNCIQPQFLYDPEEMQDIFEENIEKASYTIVNNKANYLKRWWNQEIQEAYDSKRLHLRKDVFKRIVRKAKRKHDFEMKENINESTPAKQIWNIIRGLDTSLTGNKKGADAHPPKEIAEKFVAANYKPFSSALYSVGKNINMDDDLGKSLEVAEFMQILKSKKDYSAAGIDNISYRILKQLKLDILVEICNQLNRVWRSKPRKMEEEQASVDTKT
ncbi:uncharacterized protein LOC110675209 [Aedes aegypti]|uniref:Endonuclease/exonuclease/phosphatase domain-containing protein n=1 Tax=Aedes aegypti TaxID=7159 RepID=A0A6I8TQ24_AEDAE|nr:uncharacterized protein LOC110675209 [Aedes aegypti]